MASEQGDKSAASWFAGKEVAEISTSAKWTDRSEASPCWGRYLLARGKET